MPICDICKSISFEHLPPFPDEAYSRSVTGMEHVHTLYRKRDVSIDPSASNTRHHASIEALRRAAAEGCNMCVLIQREADAIIAELASRDGDEEPYHGVSPNFDMWVTKSPGGSQGFWVLSGYTANTEGPPAVIVPVAAFAFVVAADNPLAATIRGRPISQNLDVRALQRVVAWSTECEQEHKCLQGSVPSPPRLIDVQIPESDDAVKVVELDVAAQHKYTALTYASDCGIAAYWEDNKLPEDSTVRIDGLPKIFQDAILITRILGIQYLWIDSLCIPSSSQEWARDAEQAGLVYKNAYLTLSATGSKNMADGLLFPRPLLSFAEIPYRTSDGVAESVLAAPLPLIKQVLPSRYIQMDEEPISQGVWSFQERVLSHRVMHFASDQMYFECLGHFVSEDGLLERWRYHTTVDKLPDGAEYFCNETGQVSLASRWSSILREYVRREPGVPSCKLAGLANVAREFQRMQDNDEYVAGFWKKSLIESLSWQSLRCKAAGDSNAPSWSWAAVDGITSHGNRGRISNPLATITDVSISLEDDAKPFSSVSTAILQLEAPLVALKLAEEQDASPGSHIFVSTEKGDRGGFYAGLDIMDRQYAVSANILRNMDIYVLILAETFRGECLPGGCSSGSDLCCLIVAPIDASGSKMKRIGFTRTSPSSFGPDELSSSRKTVTLV